MSTFPKATFTTKTTTSPSSRRTKSTSTSKKSTTTSSATYTLVPPVTRTPIWDSFTTPSRTPSVSSYIPSTYTPLTFITSRTSPKSIILSDGLIPTLYSTSDYPTRSSLSTNNSSTGPNPDELSPNKGGGGLSEGAAAGIAIGSLVFAILAVWIAYRQLKHQGGRMCC